MALDWTTPRDALMALTLTGADDRNRDSMVNRLSQYGGSYDSARADLGPSACDSAKAAGDAAFASATASWEGSTAPQHDSADQFARFVVGGAPIAFEPDGSAQAALTARMSEAQTALKTPGHPKAELIEELATHQQMVSSAYAARPVTAYYGPPYTTRSSILGGNPATGKAYHLHEFERDVLGPLIAEANLLIEELTFS